MEKEINKRNYYSIAILICLLLIFSSNPLTLFIDNKDVIYYIGLSLKIIFLVLMFLFIRKNELEKPKLNRLKLISLIFIPFIVLSISNIISSIVNGDEMMELNGINIIKAIVLTIFTAINEEVTFRGCLLGELLKTKSKIKSIIISSLVFGLVHLLNINSIGSIPYVLLQVGYSMYLGMILGLIYAHSGNIILPIFMHMIFNVLNNDIASSLFNIEYNIMYFVINIGIGIIIALYWLFVYYIFKKREDMEYASRDMDN